MTNPVPKIILHSDQSQALTARIDQEILRSLSGKRSPRIGYIPSTPDPRRKYFSEKAAYYETIGLSDVVYFDPEEAEYEEEFTQFFALDVIHLSGGEVGPFRRRLRDTGCDERLRSFAARGGVLLGVSAGAMLLGKTFASVKLFGERGAVDGLGFFNFEIVPHVSDHFPRMDLLESFARTEKKVVYALNDGDVVVIHGKKVRTYGAPLRIDSQ